MRSALLAHAALAASLAAAPARAQRTTWIVDASGGAGSQFTEIEPAVNAAKAGDVIVVRAGSYRGFSVTKGLSIAGEPGASFQPLAGNVTIASVPAGQDFTLIGFEWATAAVTPLTVQGCNGRVLLERATVAVNHGSFSVPGVRILASRQVTLGDCAITGGPGVDAHDSRVVLWDCAVIGQATYTFGAGYPAQPAVRARSGSLFVAGGELQGGAGILIPSPLPPASGLASAGAALRIGGDATQVRAGGGTTLPAPALEGDGGSLALDPKVTLVPYAGAAAISGSIAVVREPVPILTGQSAGLTGTVQLDLYGPAGQPFALLLGLPGDALGVLDWGELWLDLARPSFVARSGALGANDHATFAFRVPNRPDLDATALAWQGLVATGGGALRFTNAWTQAVR
jgi:hypothetical protein